VTNGVVVYRGPSRLTGDPVVVVLTGLSYDSLNFKTGPMVQAWILRADMPPTEAVNSGGDDAICGGCRHRSGSNVGRSCYVVWWFAPANVYRALPSYPVVRVSSLRGVLRDRHVRFGAYGDPAAVPATVWFDLAYVSAGWTGYTHHWQTCDPLLRMLLMASVDTEAEKREAARLGWRTFRVRRHGDAVQADEVICPASDEGRHVATCDDCRLCAGLFRDAKSVAILPHGQRVKWIAADTRTVLA
jgi:hypothetical protein